MDRKKIEAMCSRIVQAVNAVEVRGEANMAQLLGIARDARNIMIELGKPEQEAERDG